MKRKQLDLDLRFKCPMPVGDDAFDILYELNTNKVFFYFSLIRPLRECLSRP